MSISTLQALPTPLGTEKGVRATGVMLMYLICSCKISQQTYKWKNELCLALEGQGFVLSAC